jgi:hypothetical protein
VTTNRLYYGDNLAILREHIEGESVDLVYLDPPFNSKRDYKLLFKSPKGHQSEAQVEAFKAVRERENAEFALLISPAEPTAKMKADAASAGIYHGGPDGKKQFAHVQLLTIAGLLDGTQRAEHPDYIPDVNFKKAKREQSKQKNKELFGEE